MVPTVQREGVLADALDDNSNRNETQGSQVSISLADTADPRKAAEFLMAVNPAGVEAFRRAAVKAALKAVRS